MHSKYKLFKQKLFVKKLQGQSELGSITVPNSVTLQE